MAGRDTEYRGEAQLAPGRHRRAARAGARSSTSPRTCAATSRTACARCARCSTASTSWPRTTPTRPPTSSRACRSRSTPPTPGTSTRCSTRRWTRCAARPATPTSRRCPAASAAAWRSGRLLLSAARPAAARRAHEPPRRRVGGLARAPPGRVQGHDRRGHPRSLLPRQRRRLDPRARPRPRHPVQGQLLELARAEAGAPGGRRRSRSRARQRTIARELEWVRENPKGRRKKAKARLNNYERLLAEERNVKLDQVQIHIPPGQRLGDIVIEAVGAAQGLRRPAADRGPLVQRCRRAGIVGVIGANGAGKTTLFRMIVGEEQPDAGALRLGDTVDLAYVDQSRDALDPDEVRLGGDLRRLRAHQGRRPRGQLARLRGRLQLQGLRPAAQGRRAVRRRAQPRAPREAAAHAAATSCCSTSRPTTSTSTRCARWRRRCSRSRAAR